MSLRIHRLTRTVPAAVHLTARGIRHAFDGNQVLAGVDLEIGPGEVVLLRGQNGCGKTTLINVLTGLLDPDSGEIDVRGPKSASFRFPLSWRRRFNLIDDYTPERMMRLGIGRSWQDVRLFGRQTLMENLIVASEQPRGENPFAALAYSWIVRNEDARNSEAARKVLRDLDLAGHEDSLADRVSFGESKKVAIARSLQAGARILFLDEPLSGLDDLGVANVLELLRHLVENEDLAIVIVEHALNIPAVLDLAQRVWTLQDGRILEESAATVRSAHSSATNVVDPLEWLREIRSPDEDLTEHSLPAGGQLAVLRKRSQAFQPPIVEVTNLIVKRGLRTVIGWRNDRGIVEGVDLTLRAGDIAILQAPNGWGKTTLLEAIAGLIPVATGELRIGGSSLRSPHDRVRGGLVLLRPFQTLFNEMTIDENLELYRCPQVHTGFNGRATVGSLSGGQRQRVAWAITLSRSSKALLLDEPFTSVDAPSLPHLLSKLASDRRRAAFLTVPKRRNRVIGSN